MQPYMQISCMFMHAAAFLTLVAPGRVDLSSFSFPSAIASSASGEGAGAHHLRVLHIHMVAQPASVLNWHRPEPIRLLVTGRLKATKCQKKSIIPDVSGSVANPHREHGSGRPTH